MSFESITDEKIKDLIEMPKRVANPNAREVNDGAYLRRDYRVVSSDGQHEFRLFTRQNNVIRNAYTAGLQWLPPGPETLILVRYNGSSHDHPNKLEAQKLRGVCHVHRATERYIKANRKAESYAEETTRYSTVDGALHELMVDCRISGLSATRDEPRLFQ